MKKIKPTIIKKKKITNEMIWKKLLEIEKRVNLLISWKAM